MKATEERERSRYIVSTGIGDFTTVATSARKAVANVRYRQFGSAYTSTAYWTVRDPANFGKRVIQIRARQFTTRQSW